VPVSTDTLTRPEVVTKTQTGDGSPVVSHICEKEGITDAYVFGTPLTAICGHVWVPSRDPKHLPLCAACKEISDSMWGEGNVPDG
jgi:hypothetical protein